MIAWTIGAVSPEGLGKISPKTIESVEIEILIFTRDGHIKRSSRKENSSRDYDSTARFSRYLKIARGISPRIAIQRDTSLYVREIHRSGPRDEFTRLFVSWEVETKLAKEFVPSCNSPVHIPLGSLSLPSLLSLPPTTLASHLILSYSSRLELIPFTTHPSLYQSSWQQRYSHC